MNIAFFNYSTLTFDSKEITKLMFHTPIDKSYQCADVGQISLISSMQWNYTKMAPHDVSNTTANAFQVHFDAYRNIPTNDIIVQDQFRVIDKFCINFEFYHIYMFCCLRPVL